MDACPTAFHGHADDNCACLPKYAGVHCNQWALSGLSASAAHTCGLKQDGQAFCWGQLVGGEIAPAPGPFKQVVAADDGDGLLDDYGQTYVCGLNMDGSAICWGNYTAGQSGEADAPCPAYWDGYCKSASLEGPFTKLTASDGHTCGLKEDGSTVCWGYDFCKQSGGGSVAQKPLCEMPETANLNGPFIDVVAGGWRTCGLRTDGSVDCWGDNTSGQSTSQTGPYIQIAASEKRICGLKEDGSAFCWGSDGTSPYGLFSGPAPEADLVQITAGYSHFCGVKNDGSIACWGANKDRSCSNCKPDALEGPFVEVAGGGAHTCAARADGSVECWGSDQYGQSSPPNAE
jgi:alpha-tubulin suppressor-like RCC1 family protein